ncbi:MAG: apolipoprotein N-acyltransferase [Spirochaetales bacterium]|nr:apolipoprotein N-acyltransferase [Spirochaetales bacterium]
MAFSGLLPFFKVLRSVLWFFTGASVWYAYLARSHKVADIYKATVRFPRLQRVSEDLLLLALGAFLFALGFPNFILSWGMFPLAFVCLVPVFFVIGRARWSLMWVYGIFFVITGLSFYSFWLVQFHPLALTITLAVYIIYFLILFPLLKLAVTLFPTHGYLLQALIWVGYEFIKTLGFLGYSYGILGYSQYLFAPLIQLASVSGVWGVSLLVVFPSVLLAQMLKNGFRQMSSEMRKMRVSWLVYGVVFVCVLVYGIFSQHDLEQYQTWKVALIQSNIDPWKSGDAAYKHYLTTLLKLSDQALKYKPDIVMWSETALVPSIRLHNSKRLDIDLYTHVVRPFLDYIDTKPVPFLLGNDDSELDVRADGGRRHYNAVLLMENREVRQVYRKVHLVPFTEYFPYKHIFPDIYQWLKNSDTHFWDKGSEFTVFKQDGITFAAPICFEDTFGYLSREFVLKGADVLVNLSNDAWSASEVAEMQHMCIALFRAVENRKTLIRSTTSGITCVIDPNGHINSLLESGQAGFLIASVPVRKGEHTLYTVWGDMWAVIIAVFSLIGLVIGCVIKFLKLST